MRHILAKYVSDLETLEWLTQWTLQDLQKINARIASNIVAKNEILPSLRFRLISKAPDPSSFVALSYACGVQHQKDIKIRDSDQDTFRLPVSGVFSQAIMRETWPEEGLWCDQLCISQTDPQEKAVSIGLMDGIYRSARMVYIVLDDVEITAEEVEYLEGYAKDFARQMAGLSYEHSTDRQLHGNELQETPFISTQPTMMGFYLKIVNSQWFQRAWCSHEYMLSQDSVLFARCAGQTRVLRLGSQFLAHINRLGAEASDQGACRNMALSRELTGKTRRKVNLVDAWLYLKSLHAGGCPGLGDNLRAQTAQQDKFIIALNGSSSRLGISAASFAEAMTSVLPQNVCDGRVIAVAIALKQSRALATSGPFLRRQQPQGTVSWLQMPQVGSLRHGNDAIPATVSWHFINGTSDDFHEYIDLTMSALATDIELHSINPLIDVRYNSLAFALLRICFNEQTALTVALHNRVTLSAIMKKGPLYLFYVGSYLGCVLRLGTPWVYATLDFNFDTHEESTNDDLVETLMQYAEKSPHCLVVPFGPLLSPEKCETRIMNWISAMESNRILAEVLISLTLHFYSASIENWLLGAFNEEVIHFRCTIAEDANARKFLMMIPYSWRSCIMMIPGALGEDDYMGLPRVWFLVERDEQPDASRRQYHLYGKQVVLGPFLYPNFFDERREVRVYGPFAQIQAALNILDPLSSTEQDDP